MAKNPTEKSRYPSRYGAGWITGRQYIIELICEKRAQSLRKELPTKFWRLPEWEKFFKSQLRRCNVLLKQYDERAIIKAIQECSRVYSLFSPVLEAKIKIKQKEKKVVLPQIEINRNTLNSKPRQTIKPNIISKLEELDG